MAYAPGLASAGETPCPGRTRWMPSVDERVVTEGIQRVRPGQVVSPAEAKPGA